MKKIVLFGFAVITFAAQVSVAWASFSIDELHSATKVACDKFEADHSEHVPHFTGYKSWLSGEDAKVKVYVSHDGMKMEYNYVCHKHDASIECHEQ